MPEYNPDVELAPKRCPKCRGIHPRTPEFWSRNKQARDGLCCYCKLCDSKLRAVYYEANLEIERERDRIYRENNRDKRREYNRRYCENNPEKRRESNKKYAKANPDKMLAKVQRRDARLRDLPHNLTETQYANTLAYYNNACAYCGIPQSELDYTLHREHILPLTRGGGYTRDNIVPACKPCNDRKWIRTPEEAGMKLLKPWPPVA